MIDFLIKSTISLAVLLAVYRLFLEREKMHRFNRFYLISVLVFSFIIPFISYTLQAEGSLARAINQIPQTVLQEVIISEKAQFFGFTQWLIILYSLVTTVLIVRFANNIRSFISLFKTNRTIRYKTAVLVLLPYKILPHTFLNYIFISEDDYNKNAIEKDLYTHELAHVNQKHTIDVLFIEILKTIFWFNPLIYFYKKAIQLNHEFLADETVIAINKNITGYQSLLLKIASEGPVVALASNIKFSTTKKRFIMMNKTTPKLLALSKQFLVLPVMAGLFLISCAKENTDTNKDLIIEKTEKDIYNAAVLTKQPEYPGGMNGFYSSIMRNFNIPEVNEDMTKKIMVSFVVEKDGSMSDIKILKDPGSGLGDEAKRVLSAMTEKWSPGEINGEAVRTSFALPIVIKIKS